MRLSRLKLSDRARNDRVSTFSGGLKQRLNLAAALLHDPPVLLLDEPTAALDPASRDALLADLTRFRDDGHAILLTTHHVDEAESGCDRVAVLEQGKLVASGSPSELLRPRPADRPVLYGHLRARPPKYLERAIRRRLGPRVGCWKCPPRRPVPRLSAETSEELGQALASLLAEGIELEAYRTPAGALELAACGSTNGGPDAPQGVALRLRECDPFRVENPMQAAACGSSAQGTRPGFPQKTDNAPRRTRTGDQWHRPSKLSLTASALAGKDWRLFWADRRAQLCCASSSPYCSASDVPARSSTARTPDTSAESCPSWSSVEDGWPVHATGRGAELLASNRLDAARNFRAPKKPKRWARSAGRWPSCSRRASSG